jgi:hypothetical protein
MKTDNEIQSFAPKMNFIKRNNSIVTSPNAIIFTAGILTSIILFLIKISWININWKIPIIPLMIAAQIIFLQTAIKNRFKKI